MTEQIVDILVMSLPQSGKTTFIKTISTSTEWHESGWFLGVLPVDQGLTLQFLEPPATPEFDFILMQEVVANSDVPGYIVIIDSTQPHTFGEAVSILQTIRSYHPETPILVAASHQDLANAWSADDLRIGLGIPDDILVTPCIANDPELVKDSVVQLLYRVLGLT